MLAHLRLQLLRQLIAGRDDNFLQQPRFIRRDRVPTGAVPEQAHDSGVRAVKHAKDAPFRATRAISETAAALDAGQNVIAVHCVAQSVAADEQIAVQVFSRRIRHYETVTVSMRYETPGELIHLRPHRRGRFSLWLSGVPVWHPLLWRRGIFSTSPGTSLRIPLRALLFLGQANSSVWIFVDFAAPLHFSRELNERPAGGVAQAKRRGDFTEALRPAGPGQMRQNVGFGDGCARVIVAWHGPAHCMRSASKR
jgi:hypothetical protein